MERTWIVVADQSQAQLYKVSGSKMDPNLERVEVLEHPEGRDNNASSSGMSLSFVDTRGSRDEEERRFVRLLMERLREAKREGEFRKLYIAAPANFIGKVRDLTCATLKQSIEREIVGDYTHENARALTKRVKKRNWLN